MAQVGDNEAWHAVIETNLNSLFHVTKQVIDGTVERGWGRTINISSVDLDYNILFRWFLDIVRSLRSMPPLSTRTASVWRAKR